MFSTQLIRRLKVPNITRRLNTSSIMREAKEPSTKVDGDRKLIQEVIGGRMHSVSSFDRWMLVWVKRYPNQAAVPDKVTTECIIQARSRARIRTCNLMIIASLIMCAMAVISGKRDRDAGKNLHSIMQAEIDQYQSAGTKS